MRLANTIRPQVAQYCQDGKAALPVHLTTAEAASILGFRTQSVRQLIHRRQLRALPRGAYRVLTVDVLNYRGMGRESAAVRGYSL